MITKFKIFENNSKLEVGDYVLMSTNAPNEIIKEYINNTIGQIEKVFPDKRDIWNNVSVGNIVVKYKNVPNGYEEWFKREYSKKGTFLRQFHPNKVVAFGKTPEEVELKLNTDKYNL